MSGQYARLKNALNRADVTTPGPVQVAVFADDLHQILAHYITVSTELAELKAASATEACAAIPSIAEYVSKLEQRNAELVEALRRERDHNLDSIDVGNNIINKYRALNAELVEALRFSVEAMNYTGMDVGKFNRINAACSKARAVLAKVEGKA